MSILVADLETNGIYPSKIHMVGILDVVTGEFTAYVGENEVPLGLLRMAEAEMLIGHNIRGYDIHHAERLTEGLVKFDQRRVIDTLELSRDLFPQMRCHKLKEWGEILDCPKLEYKNFDYYTPEMAVYCEQDCVTTKRLYEFLLEVLESRTSETQ